MSSFINDRSIYTWDLHVEDLKKALNISRTVKPPVELCKWNGVKIREFNEDEYKIGINDVLTAENKRLKRTLREWPLCGVDQIPVLTYRELNGKCTFRWICFCRILTYMGTSKTEKNR